MVIDDEAVILRYIKSILEDSYDVCLLSDGATALLYLKTHIPDMIIMDINMPGMDGFTLLGEIRAVSALSNTPVIFITANSDPESESLGLRLGANDYITKPIRRESLLQRVSMHIAHSLEEKEHATKYEQIKQEAEKVRIDAMRDELTGLWKRTYITEQTNKYLSENRKGSILMLDIDGFKRVNDILGHHVGDKLLREFAIALEKSLGKDVIMSRVGGDEFCLFFPEIQGKRVLSDIATQILKTAELSFEISAGAKIASVSIGIAIIPRDGEDFDNAFKSADSALLQAKRQGKKTFCFAGNTMPVNSNVQETNWIHELLEGRADKASALLVDFGEIQNLYRFSCLLSNKGLPQTHAVSISVDKSFVFYSENTQIKLLDMLIQVMCSEVSGLTAIAKNGASQLIMLVFDRSVNQIKADVRNSVNNCCENDISDYLKIDIY